MKPLFLRVLAIGLAGCLAGCASPSSRAPSVVAPSLPTKLISADRARESVAVGKSAKADVAAALGDTLVIRFDSGFEVWVYRLAASAPGRQTAGEDIGRTGSEQAAPATSAEFVILFAPSGLAAKTRIRPVPQRRHEG